MLDVVSRQSVLIVPDNFDELVEERIQQINALLSIKSEFPWYAEEHLLGPYGPVQREVVRKIQVAGWMVSYNVEKRSFLIS